MTGKQTLWAVDHDASFRRKFSVKLSLINFANAPTGWQVFSH